MALSARELLIIVRAQDQASGTLRRVGSDLRALGHSGAAAGKSLNELNRQRRWDSLGRAGAIISHVGRAAQTAGLVVAAGLGYAAHAAATLSTSVELAATQTTSNFGKMQANSKVLLGFILKEMTKFPASSAQMSQSAYDIYSSLNVNLKGGMRLLDLFNKASVAGMTPLTDVTNHAITIMNDFGVSVGGMSKIFQRSFATVRFGRITFDQYTQSMNQLAPAFSAAGQSFDTMSGAFAFMTRKMPSSRMAATALARMIEIIGRKKFVDGIQKAGVAIVDTNNKLLPLPTILDRIQKKFPELAKGGTTLQNFFKTMSGTEGTIQARRAFTFFMRDLQGYHHISGQVIHDNNEFTKSLKGMSETPGVRFAKFVNTMKSLALQIGLAAIPAIEGLTRPIQKAVEWFSKLSDKTKSQIGTWAAYGAVVAVLGGTFLSIIGSLITFIALLGRMRLLGIGFLFTLTAIATGVDILHNGFQGLTQPLTAISDLLTFRQGKAGFAVAIAGIIFGLRKLISMYKDLRLAIVEAQAAAAFSSGGQMALFGGGGGGAAAAEGGMLASMFGAPARIRKSGQTIKSAYADAAASVIASKTRFYTKSAQVDNVWKSRNAAMYGGRGAALAGADIEMTRLARGATALSRLKGVAAGGAAALAMVPGPLWAIGAGLAAVAGGAILWEHHMEGVRRKADEARIAAESLNMTLKAAPKAFAASKDLGQNLRNVGMAKNDLRDVNNQIRITRQELAKASKTDKPGLQIEMNRLIYQRGDALDAVAKTQAIATRSGAQFSKGITAMAQDLVNLGHKKKEIGTLKDEITKLKKANDIALQASGVSLYGKQLDAAQSKLREARSEVLKYGTALQNSSKTAKASFSRIVTSLQRVNILPKIDARQMNIAFGAALRLAQSGKRLTLKDIKMLIRAEINPRDLTKIPAQVRRALGAAEKQQIKIEAKIQLGKDAKSGAKAFQDFLKPSKAQIALGLVIKPTADSVKKKTAAVFKPAIPQAIHLGPVTPNAGALGASIAQGVAGGIHSNAGLVAAAAVAMVDSAIAAGKAAAVSHSPSKRAADELGLPLIQGVVMGIYAGMPALQDAARLTVDLFAGTVVSAFQSIAMPQLLSGPLMDNFEKKVKALNDNLARRAARISTRHVKYKTPMPKFNLVFGLEYKDLKAQSKQVDQVTTALNGLRQRNVPAKLLEQLAQLGTDGAKALNVLVNASDKQLKKYVSLWKHTQDEINNVVNFDVLLGDLKAQLVNMRMFNNAMETLSKRGVPAKLLDQLSQLGVEGAMMIAKLAGATKAQLAAYVKYWQQTEKEVKKSTRFMTQDIASMADDAASNLLAKYNEFHDALSGWFNLFPDSISSMSNADYDAALKDYNAQVDDFNKQINDIWDNAIAAAKQNLQQQMGDLFDFSNMPLQQTKIDWGIALNMSDLKAQLKGQIDAFKNWRSDLSALAKRNVPKELIDQLEALGPAATKNLDVLVGSSDADLTDYINLWKSGQSAIGDAALKTVQGSTDILKQIAEIEKQIHDLTRPHKMTPDDVIKNLQDQKEAFGKWRDQLELLRQKKVPALLIQQLEALGPDAEPLLEQLNNMTSDQLSQYAQIWADTQKQINDETMTQLNEQIKLWEQHGKNIAQAIIAGVASEQPELEAYFKKLFLYLLTGKNPPTAPKTPGGGQGKGAGGLSTKGLSNLLVTIVNPPVHIEVNAVHSESLDATMNRVAWRIRTRR